MSFTLRLPDDLDAALTARAALTGVPKAVIVRKALEAFLPHDGGPHGTWGVPAQVVERELGEGAAAGQAEARDVGTADRVPGAPSPSFRPDFKKGS